MIFIDHFLSCIVLRVFQMVDKKFYQPSTVTGWIVIIYERQQRFSQRNAEDMVSGLMRSFEEVGMKCNDATPLIRYENGQGKISDVSISKHHQN